MALTYKDFLKKGMDLAPLGMEMGGDRVTYFCTPKGAAVIGSVGVDGIHFCFIEGFGETVFSVSPMNEVGKYVHPIARSFHDLLSLLVSVSHTAAVEQAWRWDKEAFGRFLRDNPPTVEQVRVMHELERELSIPFMEAPFDYIKELQAEFDYSKLEFTSEYYDIVGDEVEISSKPKERRVFYGGGYGMANANGADSGAELVLHKQFVWGDEVWHIPSIYLCDKGFVIDYCIEVCLDKVKEYYKKWRHTLSGEDDISHEDMIRMDRENPFDIDARSHFKVNNEVVREELGTGLYYIPEWCIPSGIENNEEAIAIMEHYGLDDTKAWAFSRHSCLWATLGKPMEIKSLSLRLERRPTAIQGSHFKNLSIGDVIVFTHPVCGTKHKLTVLEYEQKELTPMSVANNDFELPTHHTMMVYQIEPELSGLSFAIRDCASNDQPKRKQQTNNNNDFSATIGIIGDVSGPTAIIGGADGPTAVIMAQPNGSNPKVALSALHFEPVFDIEWKMEFTVKMTEDKEVLLLP